MIDKFALEKKISPQTGNCNKNQILTAETIKMLEILASGIAHDYNNLLTVILGNLSLGKSYPGMSDEIMEIFQDIEKAALNARDMTESLLIFSRMNSLDVKKNYLPDLIKKVTYTLFPENSANIDMLIAENLWEIEYDAFKMELALKNLFLFIKSEFQQNKQIRIEIKNYADESGNWQQITITDLNLVLLNDKLTDLFAPGFSVKKAGYGMGIITAYSIIQKHHGLIDIISQVDKGTTFHILLPAFP